MKQIAIAGLGVVGGGVADLLVNHAAVIEKKRGRGGSAQGRLHPDEKAGQPVRVLFCVGLFRD